jgi:prepilin-type N-terminal cleavage/methylation domain-containing protein
LSIFFLGTRVIKVILSDISYIFKQDFYFFILSIFLLIILYISFLIHDILNTMFHLKTKKNISSLQKDSTPPKAGFTLIELLIVIGVLAILATVVVLVLNPTEMFKQARDSQRLSETDALNQAILLYQTNGGTNLGDKTKIYISIATSSLDCGYNSTGNSLNLPNPTPRTYQCTPSSTYRKIDGFGWVPINFTNLSIQSPLTILPIDPVNTVANGYYYTYAPGSWELTTAMESAKYQTEKGRIVQVGTEKNITPSALIASTRYTPPVPFSATGGAITEVGGYRIHAFIQAGTFTPNGNGNIEVLVVAGGGGGASGIYSEPGGGAGGLIYNASYAVTAQGYSVTVGAGGAVNTNGENSVFDSFIAIGGGKGYKYGAVADGGSGGGGECSTVGLGTTGQGNNGGQGYCPQGGYSAGGGGGGAGGVGGNGWSSGGNSYGGNGGTGLTYSISGSSICYAGGGAGGGQASGGTATCGGGGNGSSGTANTGGGGGRSATGGSGIVIIRYPL